MDRLEPGAIYPVVEYSWRPWCITRRRVRHRRRLFIDAIVAESGDVNIPEDLGMRLGITSQVVFEFNQDNGKLMAVTGVEDDPLSRAWGFIDPGMSADEFLNLRRGEP